MTRLALLSLLFFVPPTLDDPGSAPTVRTYDLALLRAAEAARLQGRRALFLVTPDSRTGESDGGSLWFDNASPDGVYRSVRLLPAQELSDQADTLVVQGTLQVIRHSAVKGNDHSEPPGLVEYRLTGAVAQHE
jgi:hypothetical protein